MNKATTSLANGESLQKTYNEIVTHIITKIQEASHVKTPEEKKPNIPTLD